MALNFNHQLNKLSSSSETVTIDNTGSIRIPAGSNLERPGTPSSGEIRYNSDLQSFEGYINTNWTSLGGVKDVDGNTYIIAETSPGANNNELDFYTNGVQRLQIGSSGSFGYGDSLNKFTINYSTGDTAIAGTLGVASNFNVATNKFTVNATSGNTAVAGTLGVTGATTLTGSLTANGGITVGATQTIDAGANAITNVADPLNNQDAATKYYVDNTIAAGNNLSITDGVNNGTVDLATDTFTISGTASEITSVVSGTTVTIGLPSDVTISNNLIVSNYATVTSDLTVSGLALLNNGLSLTGNATVSGTLDVNSDVGVDGNFDINTNKFTVNAASGNTAVAGTLGVASNFNVATNKFTVNATSGNTAVAGTLGVTGATTLTGLLTANGGITVGATQTIDMGANKVTNLSDPTDNQDAATKAYVDSNITAQDLDFAGDGATSGSVDLDSQTFTIAGTINEIITTASSQTLTVGLTTDVTIANDLTVTNDAYINNDLSVTNNATITGTLDVTDNFAVNTNKFTVNATSGDTAIAGILSVTGAAGVDGNFDVATNKFTVNATSGDTAIAGILSVTGAAGIDGNFDVATNKFTVNATSGNTAVAGTLGVASNFDVNTNKFTVNATSGDTAIAGILSVTGAAGIDGNFDINTNKFTVNATSGDTAIAGTLGVTGATTLSSTLDVTGAAGVDGNFDVNTNKFTVNATSGDTAIAGILSVTGAAGIDGNFDINTNKFTVNATSGDTAIAGILSVTGAAGVDGNFDVNTNKFTVNATSGDTAIAGILSVTGAAGVDGNFDVNTNKFTVDAATGDTTVGRHLTVAGDLTVNGTTTTVNSTITTIDDPVITLGGDTAPVIDDNKDRGIEFRWHNGTSAKVGFFGFDDSSGKFTYIPDATNTGEVFSGTVGDAAFGNVTLGSSTINSIQLGISASNEIDTTAGNLILDSFSGTVEITDNATISGTLDVTGAAGIDGNFDVATNKFTVNATSGNTAIAGTLGVTGDVAVNTNKFNITASSGNTLIAGTLGVAGESTLASAIVSDLTNNRIVIAGTSGALEDDANFRFDGTNFDIGASGSEKFRVIVASGNTTVAGTLDVTGAVGIDGNFDIATNKFTVASASGNTAIAGTLDVTGAVGVDGNFDVASTKFVVAAASGNTTIAGTLGVTGDFAINTNKFNVTAATGATTIGNTLGVSGNTTIDGNLYIRDNSLSNRFTVANSTGNTTVGGTLGVTGATTLSSTLAVTSDTTLSGLLNVTGNVNVNTNKFNIVAASGNTSIAGTLGVTGATALSSTLGVTGDFAINTNKFNVTAASGNTSIAGTLGVTGATTLSSTANVVGNFSVNTNKFAVNATTGAATFNNAFTLPTTDGAANTSLTTNGSGTVTWVDTNTLINWNVANNYAFKSITDGSNTAVADSNTDTFKIRSSDQIEVTVTNDDATHGDSVLIGHADSGVIANTYGSTTAIPVITVDAQGHVTNVTTSSISTYWTLSDGSNTQQIDGSNTLTVSGTANEIEVAVSATDTLTIGLTTDVTIGNDLTVTTDASVGNDLSVTNNTLLGGTLQVTGATTLSSTLDVTGVTNFNDTTASSSYTTGAVIIDGGAGIAGALYVNGTVNTTEVNLSYTDFAGIANASAPTYQEGRMYYDTDAKTLVLYGNSSDFDMPVGEREWLRVRNSSGATIYKGQPVYATGVHISGHPIHGHHPTVDLADASDVNKVEVLGLAGHDIADGNHGYVIARGYIDNINTSALTSGSRVHLGFASPGTIVDSAPGYPNYPVDLGLCLTSDASVGTIYVDIQTHTFERLRVTGSGRVDGDFTVGGNLTILGSSSSVSLNNLNVDSSFIYLNAGDTIGEGNTNFTGSGLDDASFVGHFNGTSSTTYYVRIDSVGGGTGGVDTFEWSLDNFSTTEATGVDLSTSPVALQDNISIVWAATTGHTLNDVWDGTAAPVNVDNAIIGNRNTGTSGVGYTHIGLFFDVSDEKWKIFSEYDPEPTSTIDTSDVSFTLGTLVANTFEGGLNGNASTATQLATSRTLWGQSFDGSGNVSGNLTSVGNITGSSAVTLSAGGSDQNITITPSGTGYTLLNGNVGINVATPAEKLHVEGAVRIDSTYNLYSATATLSTTSQTSIASFSTTTFGGGKVVIQVYDTITGARTITELLVVHNGSVASATQYGIINTGASDLADFDVDISGGNVRILATQASTNSTQYKVVQTLILA